MKEGYVVWLTGLPSAGKTTIGVALAESLRQRGGKTEILDGDEVRRSLSADLGFSVEDREKHNKRIIYVSKLLVRNGIVVVVPLISPYKAVRTFARNELGRFIEVYVKCPLEECIRRDVKGLYARALKGEIADFTGVTAPYEEPEHPDVIVKTDKQSVEECVQRILTAIFAGGYKTEACPSQTTRSMEPR